MEIIEPLDGMKPKDKINRDAKTRQARQDKHRTREKQNRKQEGERDSQPASQSDRQTDRQMDGEGETEAAHKATVIRFNGNK